MTSTDRITGRLDIDCTALDPIHHGAGTVGNVQMIRVQPIVLDDGSEARVPYISGNSIKHMIREGGARFALEALGIGDGELTKGMIDLLFSGGGLTKGGSAVNLAKARELERLFPLLPVLGYSAGNTMTASKLRVDHLHLVCRENLWRMPEQLRALPVASRQAGSLRSDEFGTRHDALRSPQVAAMLESETRRLIEADRSTKAGDKGVSEKALASSQMIYEFEAIMAGSRFWGGIEFRDLSPVEVGALQSAIGRASAGVHGDCHVFHIGAKSSIGFGRVAIRFAGELRHIERLKTDPADAIAVFGEANAPTIGAYVEHLRQHRADLLAALREAAE